MIYYLYFGKDIHKENKMAPRLRVIQLEKTEDRGTLKLELYDSKRTYGYLAFSYYSSPDPSEWYLLPNMNERQNYVFLTALDEDRQDRKWDVEAFADFLEQLQNKNKRGTSNFSYGGDNTGICFYVEGDELVFGYGRISPYSTWGIGLDTEYRVKLRKHTIKELKKLHEILQ